MKIIRPEDSCRTEKCVFIVFLVGILHLVIWNQYWHLLLGFQLYLYVFCILAFNLSNAVSCYFCGSIPSHFFYLPVISVVHKKHSSPKSLVEIMAARKMKRGRNIDLYILSLCKNGSRATTNSWTSSWLSY